MSATPFAPPAVARQWNLGVPIAALALNRRGDWIAASLGDGSVCLLPASDEANKPHIMPAHNGVSLSLEPDADDLGFLSGGDDGHVFIIEPGVDAPTLLAERKGQWIDHVATSTEGLRAYASGKRLILLDKEGEEAATWQTPSSIGGLAFSPNGKRLAASHYNGLSLWWTKAKEPEAERLEGKGSYLAPIWPPDGKNVIAALQEPALHGWRLDDKAEMHMRGYSAKVRSMGFTARGRYLATSGAAQIICWPFAGGGPWDKKPLTLGGSDGRLVTCVKPHLKDELVAAGYEDGMIIMAPLDGRMEVIIHPPIAAQGACVMGLAWNGDGDCLFAALENGTLLLFTLDSVSRAIRPGM